MNKGGCVFRVFFTARRSHSTAVNAHLERGLPGDPFERLVYVRVLAIVPQRLMVIEVDHSGELAVSRFAEASWRTIPGSFGDFPRKSQMASTVALQFAFGTACSIFT